MIIDVDTHWESTGFAPGEHPLEPWLDRFPADSVERLAHGIAGDLLNSLPLHRRPDGRTLLPALVRLAEERGGPIILHPQHDSTSAERVAWMDRIGIDHCLVNPGGYWQFLEFLGPDRAAGVTRCNDFLAERLAGDADRLHGVAVVDFTDLPSAVAELERARALGHRAFFLYTVNGRPPGATPPGHPDWDVVWSAAVGFRHDRVHPRREHRGRLHRVGRHRLGSTGWGRCYRADQARQYPTHPRRTKPPRVPAVRRSVTRHPRLTVVLEEMKVGWCRRS